MNKSHIKYLKFILIILIIISIGQVSAATCGNGRVEAGEECDEGYRNGNYECTTDCKIEYRHIITTLGATSPSGGQDYVYGYYTGNLGGFDGAKQICQEFAEKELHFTGNSRYNGNWIPILNAEVDGQQIYTLNEIEDTTYYFLFISSGIVILHDIVKDDLVETIARRQYESEDISHDAQLNAKIQSNGFSYWTGIDPTGSGYQDNCYDWAQTNTNGTVFHHYQRVFDGELITVSEFNDNRTCYATDSSTEVVGAGADAPARSKINFESNHGAALICANTCGDGVLQTKFGEECDDGSVVKGDGCSSSCKVEPGYICQGTPICTCNTVCGDSVKTFDEECDDGNNDNNDGCKNDCTVDIMLITQNEYDGNLSGFTGADQKCTDEAESLGYSGLWKAVLHSDGMYTINLVDIYEGLYFFGNNYVANNRFDDYDLWMATIEEPNVNCAEWDSNSGEHTATVYTSSNADYSSCDSSHHLLCVKDQCGNNIINIVNLGEDCDDGSDLQTECAYGTKECTVCNNCLYETLTGVYCGDGTTQGNYGEQCDDGKHCEDGVTSCDVDSDCIDGDRLCKPRSDDGCSAYCMREYCSNNLDCDDGNDCTHNYCNINDEDDSSSCDNPAKSNGISALDGLYCNGAETCSGGIPEPGTLPIEDDIDCTEITCDEGNDYMDNAGTLGYVYLHSNCSDNIISTKDTCTQTGCLHEEITECINDDLYCPPGCNANTDNDCNPVCGNNVIEGDEVCDDNNNLEGDGCSPSCTIECTSTSCEDNSFCYNYICEPLPNIIVSSVSLNQTPVVEKTSFNITTIIENPVGKLVGQFKISAYVSQSTNTELMFSGDNLDILIGEQIITLSAEDGNHKRVYFEIVDGITPDGVDGDRTIDICVYADSENTIIELGEDATLSKIIIGGGVTHDNIVCTTLTVLDGDDDGDGYIDDCDDNDGTVYQLLDGYPDVDGDTYTTGAVQELCSGTALPAGYLAITAVDCNDNDGTINPGATEICDGVDNNCVGGIDEGLTRDCSTDCEDGIETCNGGVWGICDAQQPGTEVCDGIDNNCDGDIDEGYDLGTICYVGVGACETDGELECSGDGSGTVCNAVAGTPGTEDYIDSTSCSDGIDNDCDDDIDDDDIDCDECSVAADCVDTDVCNGAETCVSGSCVAGTPLVCDNSDVCDGAETCDATLGCQSGTPLAYDDGLFCNGVETCDATLGRQYGTAPDCDDGVSCTVDGCDEDECTYDTSDCDCINDAVCDDGNDCTSDSCNLVTGKCIATNDNTLTCDDSNLCTENEQCSEGTCVGITKDCSASNELSISECNNNPDDNPVTLDTYIGFTSLCDEATGSCTTETPSIDSICSTSCGAECAVDVDCGATICNTQNYCDDADGDGFNDDYYIYVAVDNICLADCTCETNACGSPTISLDDAVCDDCVTADDCNSLDNNYCDGLNYISQQGKCETGNCMVETTSTQDCNDGDSCTVDACTSSGCVGTPASCGETEGCCPSGCNSNIDVDCSATCGNHVIEGVEECDDNNNVNGDGCSSECLIEECGNTRVDFGEECDDGNLINNDGCSATCEYEIISTLFSNINQPNIINEIGAFNLDETQINYYTANRGFVVEDVIEFTINYEEVEFGKINVIYNEQSEWEVVSNTLSCDTDVDCLNLTDSVIYFSVPNVGIYNLDSELYTSDGIIILESQEFEIENQQPIVNEFTTKLYDIDGYLANNDAVENQGLLNIWFNVSDYESPVYVYTYNGVLAPIATIQKGEIIENLYTDIFNADSGNELFCVYSENEYCAIEDAFVIDQTCELDGTGCHCSCNVENEVNSQTEVKFILSEIYQESLIDTQINVDASGDIIGEFPSQGMTKEYSFGDCTRVDSTSELCNILVYFVDTSGVFTVRNYEFTINLFSQGEPIVGYIVDGQNTDIVVPVNQDIIFDASSSQYRDPMCDGDDDQCYVADVFDPKELEYNWYMNIRNTPWGNVDNSRSCINAFGDGCSVTGSLSERAICDGDCTPNVACTCPSIDIDGQIYNGEIFNTQSFTYNFEDKYVCDTYPTSSPCQVTLEVTDKFSKLISKQIFNIRLEEQVNAAPEIAIQEFSNPESGQLLTFDIYGTDSENDALTLGGTTLPDGASVTLVSENNWKFSWDVPVDIEVKQISMTLTLSDGYQTTSEIISFTIDSSLDAIIKPGVCGKGIPVGEEIMFESASNLGSAENVFYVWELENKGEPWGYLESQGFSLVCSNGDESCEYGEYLPNSTASSGTPCTCEIIEDYDDSWNIYPDSKIVIENRPFILYTYDNLNDCPNSVCDIKLTVVTEDARSSASCSVNLILEGDAGDLDGDGVIDKVDLAIFRQVLLSKNPTRVRDPSDLDNDGRLTINDYIKYLRGGSNNE
jgi:cysteine-rich repeat protein